MQYFQSTKLQRLTAYVSVPRTEYVSRTVDIHHKAATLTPDVLLTAKELVGAEAYQAILDQYGVCFELFIDDMIERGYVSLRGYQRDQSNLYAFDPRTDRGYLGSEEGIPAIPLNRLLLDIE